MNNWKAVIAVAGTLVAITAAEGAAQVNLSVAGGPSFPTGSDQHLDTGFNVQLSAGFSLPLLPFGVRADGAFNRFTEDHGNFDVLSGTLNGLIRLPLPGISPYLIAGGGLYSVKDEAHGDERETNFGVNGGVGVRLPLPGLSVFAEARYHAPFGDEAVRFIPVSLGIRF
jgi:hypothetical protein